MMPQIYYTKTCDLYVLKLVGVVRFTDYRGFSQFQTMLSRDPDWTGIMVDATQLEHVDSTGLGLLAGCAIVSQQLNKKRPVIFIAHPDLDRLLTQFGFDQAFDLHYSPVCAPPVGQESCTSGWEALSGAWGGSGDRVDLEWARKILEAHQNLAQMNEKNRHLFQDVITTFREDLQEQALKRGRQEDTANKAG